MFTSTRGPADHTHVYTLFLKNQKELAHSGFESNAEGSDVGQRVHSCPRSFKGSGMTQRPQPTATDPACQPVARGGAQHRPLAGPLRGSRAVLTWHHRLSSESYW